MTLTFYNFLILSVCFSGQPVLKVICDDLDRNANLEYSIVEPIIARDKTGNKLNNRAGYDFMNAFSINPSTGKLLNREVGPNLKYFGLISEMHRS